MFKLPILSQLLIVTLILFVINPKSFGQNYGIQLNTNEAFEGYVLFDTADKTFLINNCGEVVHSWDMNNADLHSKLTPDGHLIYHKIGKITEIDWDGNLVAEISSPIEELILFRYEVIKKENGNYLTVGRRQISNVDFEAIGYDLTGVNPYEVDMVIEVDGQGDIIWEWNITDHVIQEGDPAKPNYGIVSENPQLINMDAVSRYDWNTGESFMINSFDYNPELELIAISVRKLSEFMIIDQSTTTEIAKGSTGGRYGKGGDILYRWGNPQNYGRGTAEDRMLWFQHNPNWVDSGPDKGKMTVFDNGLNRPGTNFDTRYSSVPILSPPMDANGNFILNDGEAFGPAKPEKQFDKETTNSIFYSSYTSGAEILDNGNVFISMGGEKNGFIELDSYGRIVWDYNIPYQHYIYRAEKYPLDYPAFEGKDLSPKGYVESPTSSYPCQLKVGTNDGIKTEDAYKLTNLGTYLLVENLDRRSNDYSIFDVSGRLHLEGKTNLQNYEIDISTLLSGMYFLRINNDNNQQHTFKIVVP